MFCRRAQGSLEFLLVLTAFFAVFIVIASSSVLLTGKSRELLCVKNAQVALNHLASAVDSVYILGPGNSTEVAFNPPGGCVWNLLSSSGGLLIKANGKELPVVKVHTNASIENTVSSSAKTLTVYFKGSGVSIK